MDSSKRWMHPVWSSRSTLFAVLLCWMVLCLVESKADVRECYCSSCSSSAGGGDAPPTCLTNGSCYTQIDELRSGAVKLSQGCLSQRDSMRLCQLSEGLPSLSCCSENLCNKFPSLRPRQRKLLSSDNTQSSSAPDSLISEHVLTLTVGVCAAVVLAGLLIATAITLFICYICYYSKGRGGHCPQPSDGDVEAATGKRCSAIVPQHETLSGMLTQLSPQSPSLSLLIQEDVVSKVVLLGMLRRGTFSSYHEGRWREEKVCVRVYPELHEQMFYSESNLYQTLHMRHENIVTFIAAQSHKRSSTTNVSFQYLITVHYERGVLADHLAASTLDVRSTLLLAKSAAAGLAHLHREVLGVGGRVEKDGIAHRNVTSRAFWIKADGSCCLGDLSLAVKNDAEFRSHLKCKPSGHTHYLSPELLHRGATSTQEGVSFEELKKSDVYAFSLVMWEIARRCLVHGAVEAAELPYAHVGCGEACHQGACAQIATSDQMKETVFTRKSRPPLAEQWSLDDTMQSYVFLFVESWSDELDKRPSLVSLKNSLDKLHSRCSLIREETNSSSKSCSQQE